MLCAPVIAAEARSQHKDPQAHYAHLVVHGMLHLQGYDHEHDDEAAVMEARETEIVTELGYPDPYALLHAGRALPLVLERKMNRGGRRGRGVKQGPMYPTAALATARRYAIRFCSSAVERGLLIDGASP